MVPTCGYVGSEMFACHGAYSEEFGCLSASGVLKLSLHVCMGLCIFAFIHVYLIMKKVNKFITTECFPI